MFRTADKIEENKSLKSETAPKRKKQTNPRSLANLKPYPKGVSGNPGGKPKFDIAKEIAQAVFEQNKEAAYAALSKALLKGNAYVFKELAERAYGKLKETKEVTHLYADTADADLSQRIADLERDLGLAREIDEAGRAGIAQAGTEKANGAAKDTPILP